MLIRNMCDSNNYVQDAIKNLKTIDFDTKTQEILDKYQIKREELEKIKTNFERNKDK